MPVPKHLKVSALGRIDGTPERFSYSFSLHSQDNPDNWNLTDDAWNSSDYWPDVAEDVRAFHARADTAIHPACVLETVKFAVVEGVAGTNGKPDSTKYDLWGDKYNMREINVVDTPGGSTTTGQALQTILPQSALAVTLQSDRIGPTGRGRFYLPMPVLALGSDMRVTAADAATIRDSVKTMFENIGNQPGIDWVTGGLEPTVVSSKGYRSAVTSIKVGRVIDTIRSRRNALKEGYVFVGYDQND